MTYWAIMWYDMTISYWPTKRWTAEQLDALTTVKAYVEIPALP